MSHEQKNSQTRNRENHTSILYFHGMGTQRRYEEISRLIDGLDQYQGESFRQGCHLGKMTKIRARLEPSTILDNDVSYVRVIFEEGERSERTYSSFRFYEVYWAPLTSDGTTAKEVIKWVARQITTPLKTMFSPWRERQRLRRSALHCLWDSKYPHGAERDDRLLLQHMVKEYNRFARLDVRENYPKGSFDDFLSYLKDRLKKKPERQTKLLDLARQWRKSYIFSEIFNMLVILTLLIAIGLGIGAFLALIAMGLKILNDLTLFGPFLEEYGLSWVQGWVAPTWKNMSGVGLFLATLFGLTRFLKDYLGDVQLWSTYEETDSKYKTRKEILKRGTDMLRHVLSDNQCDRVVVIAHSLGTAIAMDSLLNVGRYNRARHLAAPMKGPLPLEKLDHFVTMGSPIDKIHYFFESHLGRYHRYNRVVDEVRGDIGTAPFSRINPLPHVHWVNFWDKGDIISSSLETPTNSRNAAVRVDNIHVSSLWFPLPGASHSAYFSNQCVLEKLYGIIFKGYGSFSRNPKTRKMGKDYEELFLGPGTFSRTTVFFRRLCSSCLG